MREVTLVWAGETYTIPANKAFQIGEQVEEIVTLADIAGWAQRPRMFKLARCYALMLRFAGCRAVTDAQVHAWIMGESDGDGDAASRAGEAITALAELLVGGARPATGEDPKPGKPSAS